MEREAGMIAKSCLSESQLILLLKVIEINKQILEMNAIIIDSVAKEEVR